MGYSPTEYAEFTEPPTEMSSHGFHRFTQILRVRCSPTEFTEFTEFGSVGMAGMPYPPTSVRICVICGRLFSARSFCEFRAFCGNLFPPTDFTDLHRYLWCAVLQQNTEFGSVGMAGMPYPPTSVLICVICGRFFSARGSVYSAYSVGEYPIAGGVGMAGMPYPPTSVNIRAVCGRLFSARGSVSSVLICGRLFSARSFCAFRAFCGNIFSPTEFTESTEFVSVGIAGMPYPPNLCASVPSVGVLSLQEVLCIRCIPWELLHRLFGWCS